MEIRNLNSDFMRVPKSERGQLESTVGHYPLGLIMNNRGLPDWEQLHKAYFEATLRNFRSGALADLVLDIDEVIEAVTFVEGLAALARNKPAWDDAKVLARLGDALHPGESLEAVLIDKALIQLWPQAFGELLDGEDVTAYIYLASPSTVLALTLDDDGCVRDHRLLDPASAAKRLAESA